jgi:hypothetical protein
MFALRIAGVLVLFATVAGVLLFFVTGDRKYLRFAFQVFKWAVIFALLLLTLLFAERLITLL